MDIEAMIMKWKTTDRVVVPDNLLVTMLDALVAIGEKNFAIYYLGGNGWGISKMYN